MSLRGLPSARFFFLIIFGLPSFCLLTTCSPIPLHMRNPEPVTLSQCFADTNDAPVAPEAVAELVAPYEEIELPFDLSGTWAHKEWSSTFSVVPIVGQIETITTSFLRAELQQIGSHIVMTVEDCGMFSDTSTQLSRFFIPEPYIRAMEPGTRHAVVTPQDGGYRLRQYRFLRLLGIDLEDPAHDPLPGNEDDPRIFDDDGDGHPGLTVRVEGVISGDIYVLQRNWNELCGTVVSPDHMEGYLRWAAEQQVLGASNFLLNSNPESMPNPDPEEHRFIHRRIDPSMTCADIVRDQEQIFGGSRLQP
ncbi:MAG: hypothetical protein JW797_12695 [Bradymonadales bacterium]|nr:hypothetical protein [Bradymonadales bacterium]